MIALSFVVQPLGCLYASVRNAHRLKAAVPTRRTALIRGLLLLYACACLMQTSCMPGASSTGGPSGGAPSESPPAQPASPEAAALLNRLTALAESRAEADQSALATDLAQPATLDILDKPPERNLRSPQDLSIARIFERLRDNPAATNTLQTLSKSSALNGDWRLQQLLIRAFAHQRPLLPDSLAYLDAQSQPKSLNLQIVIMTLVENESAPAMALLGRKLADPKLDDNNKISWIRYQILPKRRSADLLLGVEDWLARGNLNAAVRTALVEALFDYRPREWGGTELPKPPDDSTTNPSAAKVLRRIGKQALDGDYPKSVKQAVRETLGKLP